MDIRKKLLEDYSKQGILEIANYIGMHEDRFASLLEIVSGDDKLLGQRAGWAVSHCLDAHPSLAARHVGLMLNLLEKDAHDAVHRCVLRSFESIELPEESHGKIIDSAFKVLMNRSKAAALRIYAMTVIYRLSGIYPEIKPELDLVLNEEMEYGSPGFRNRGKKILQGRYRLKGEDRGKS